jgi:cytochrome c oxidase subunit 1
MMNERLGKLHFWLTFIGFNLTFMPMHWTGLLGMPRRVYTYDESLGVTGLNVMSSVGAFLLGASVLLLIANWIWSVKYGPIAGPDPWNGGTLEWTIPSPPPEYNFRDVPTVHSATPFWDEKYGAHGEGVAPRGAGVPAVVSTGLIAGQEPDELPTGPVQAPSAVAVAHHESAHELGIHMPNPSYYPLVTAIGMGTIFAGLMLNPFVSISGVAIMFWGIYGWAFEPAG